MHLCERSAPFAGCRALSSGEDRYRFGEEGRTGVPALVIVSRWLTIGIQDTDAEPEKEASSAASWATRVTLDRRCSAHTCPL